MSFHPANARRERNVLASLGAWTFKPFLVVCVQRAEHESDVYLQCRTQNELDDFLALEHESVCNMCPAHRRPFDLAVPMPALARRPTGPGGGDRH